MTDVNNTSQELDLDRAKAFIEEAVQKNIQEATAEIVKVLTDRSLRLITEPKLSIEDDGSVKFNSTIKIVPM